VANVADGDMIDTLGVVDDSVKDDNFWILDMDAFQHMTPNKK
jgi:hypothetical protein